jgi:hypothetical protein
MECSSQIAHLPGRASAIANSLDAPQHKLLRRTINPQSDRPAMKNLHGSRHNHAHPFCLGTFYDAELGTMNEIVMRYCHDVGRPVGENGTVRPRRRSAASLSAPWLRSRHCSAQSRRGKDSLTMRQAFVNRPDR